MSWKSALFALTLIAAMQSVATVASAQAFPNRPIRLVNPYAPGGSTDPVLRLLGQKLSESWGQPVVIDSKPGAGTNIGTEIVAHAPPDGYTWLNATSSLAINPSLYSKLPFDPQKDLAAIAMLTLSPNVLAVNSSVPAKSVSELIAYARANPGKLAYGSSGNGATNHLAMELFKSMAGVDLVHVPYKGGGAALNDLLAGQIQVLFNPPSSIMPHANSGRIRALAVTSEKPLPGLDLPTVAESGLPGFESTVWFALFAPAGTPRAIIDKINADVNRVLKDKDVSEQLHKTGLIPVGGTPEELAAYLKQDTARWTKVVRQSGAHVD